MKSSREPKTPPPAKPAPSAQPAPMPHPAASDPSWMPCLFAGLAVAYLLFMLIPVFFNSEHKMGEICRVFRMETVGGDLAEILRFSRSWVVEHKTPYVLSNSYPPFETLFFTPLLFLKFQTAYVLISVVTVLLYLFIALALPAWIAPGRRISPALALLAGTGLFSHGLIFELERGQFNVITMAFCLLAIYLFHFHPRRRKAAYGLFILACQLKIYPAIFIVMLVDDWRDWRVNLKRFGILGAVNFLALFLLGFSRFREFLAATLKKMTDVYIWIGNHSITSYAEELHHFYRIPNGQSTTVMLLGLLLLFAAFIAVAAFRGLKGFNPWLLLACTVCALVIPAVSHDYALSYLPAPLAIFFDFLRPPAPDETRVSRFWRTLLVLGMAFAYFTMIFSVYNKAIFYNFFFPQATPMLFVIIAADFVLFLMDRRARNDTGRP